MRNKKIYIFALAAHGEGISGSDRIFIESARILSEEFEVEIYVWEEGYRMCERHGLNKQNIRFKVVSINSFIRISFFITYIYTIIKSILIGLSLKIDNSNQTIIYSASEFWMDSLPALILKKRFKYIKWVAAWFQTAPNPLEGFNDKIRGERFRIKTFLYWLTQFLVKPFIQKNADLILVNNKSEVKNFKNLKHSQKIMIFLGALDLDKINKYKEKNKSVKKIYQAVFQGRFHPQKGVLELINIWKIVVDKKPNAVLAMIGDGPLMMDVKKRIKDLNMGKNITLFGYLFDGPIKYKIFAQSQIVVHPSFYDSGGMAAAEAMAFGLPAVGFNLEAYKSYYPKGTIKVEIGNNSLFAKKIIELLNKKNYYNDVVHEVQDMLQLNWSFRVRVKELLQKL
jgi:glycosyltransferase involved in cell wall biosynthesis